MAAILSTPIRLLKRMRRWPASLTRHLAGRSESSVIPPATEAEALQVARAQEEFDADYYLRSNLDVSEARADPWQHFLQYGWKENRDPAENFSTSYYLSNNPDVAASGMNPFIHYVNWGLVEGRRSEPLATWMDRQKSLFRPKVSVIVPNYNHARFLRQRIDCILGQSYQNIELLLLDDKSSDDSAAIIREYCNSFPDRVRSILNETNSGNVFAQWQKGLQNTDGDFVWICESDDFCDTDFLTRAIGHFIDQSVNIVFGRIQFADTDGNYQPGLDAYREGAESGIWTTALVRPANEWFAGAFGVNNVIANVGGCVWRRPALPDQVWNEARTYTILGDWFLYCHVAGGGQIAYEPSALTYFRQHGANTSVSFTRPAYYSEHERLMITLRSEWQIPEHTVDKFLDKVVFQYRHFNAAAEIGPLEKYIDKSRILSASRHRHHILIAFLGFHPGGGELFPLNLANALVAAGHKVSLLAYDLEKINSDMRGQVHPSIAVYDAMRINEIGVDYFLKAAGITVINSHMALLDLYFFDKHKIKSRIPYLATLHGSYECFDLDDGSLMRVLKGVSHWVYTAEKNLLPFSSIRLDKSIFTKFENAMPFDPRPFPLSRHELGIDEETVVFTLVARGIQRKGWRAAIEAFTRLRSDQPNCKMHLLLCGEGDQTSYHMERYDKDPNISFLGYQSCIHGLYKISDCALVPTRFAGELFPLCIIQAMQVGTPIIASRIGEIEAMMTRSGSPPGILIDVARDTEQFIHSLQQAMSLMLDEHKRAVFSSIAASYGQHYDMTALAGKYFLMFKNLADDFPLQYSDSAKHTRSASLGNNVTIT